MLILERDRELGGILNQCIHHGFGLHTFKTVSYTHLKAYEDASVSEDQMIMALKTMANNVVPMPNIPEMDVMWSVTDDLLAAVNKLSLIHI